MSQSEQKLENRSSNTDEPKSTSQKEPSLDPKPTAKPQAPVETLMGDRGHGGGP